MYLRAVNPSISGISISIVITSGCISLVLLMASTPFRAFAITSSSGELLIISDIILRMNAESSTTRTLILAIEYPLLPK